MNLYEPILFCFYLFLIRKAEFLVFVTHWRHFMLEKDWIGENELVWTKKIIIKWAEFLVFVTHWRHSMPEKDWIGKNKFVWTDFVLIKRAEFLVAGRTCKATYILTYFRLW